MQEKKLEQIAIYLFKGIGNNEKIDGDYDCRLDAMAAIPAQECAEAMARVTSKGETICLCKATHEVMEAYNGERE